MDNNKIEVGEYVRTKDGIIDEVIIEYNGKCNNPNCNMKHISCKCNYYDEKDIVKHSKNIIDLIEVGDYVNGDKVDETRISCFDSIIFVNNYAKELHNEEIKSVVTKEQFNSIKYEIKEG